MTKQIAQGAQTLTLTEAVKSAAAVAATASPPLTRLVRISDGKVYAVGEHASILLEPDEATDVTGVVDGVRLADILGALGAATLSVRSGRLYVSGPGTIIDLPLSTTELPGPPVVKGAPATFDLRSVAEGVAWCHRQAPGTGTDIVAMRCSGDLILAQKYTGHRFVRTATPYTSKGAVKLSLHVDSVRHLPRGECRVVSDAAWVAVESCSQPVTVWVRRPAGDPVDIGPLIDRAKDGVEGRVDRAKLLDACKVLGTVTDGKASVDIQWGQDEATVSIHTELGAAARKVDFGTVEAVCWKINLAYLHEAAHRCPCETINVAVSDKTVVLSAEHWDHLVALVAVKEAE
jgi:hypothetical protein